MGYEWDMHRIQVPGENPKPCPPFVAPQLVHCNHSSPLVFPDGAPAKYIPALYPRSILCAIDNDPKNSGRLIKEQCVKIKQPNGSKQQKVELGIPARGF